MIEEHEKARDAELVRRKTEELQKLRLQALNRLLPDMKEYGGSSYNPRDWYCAKNKVSVGELGYSPILTLEATYDEIIKVVGFLLTLRTENATKVAE